MNIENLELPRRIIHSTGISIPLTYVLFSNTIALLLILFTLLVGTITEYLRLWKGISHPIIDSLTRPYEDEKLAGYYMYILGCLFVWVIFIPEIAVAAILLLALGDPIGGMLSDASATERKSLKTITVVFLVGVVLTSIVFYTELSDYTLVIGVFGGIGVSLADSYKLSVDNYIIDDNIVIPVLSATLITFCYTILTGETGIAIQYEVVTSMI